MDEPDPRPSAVLCETPSGDAGPLKELDLKIGIALRLLGHFECLHRRWPANEVYLELIQGLEAHLEYWDARREALRPPPAP